MTAVSITEAMATCEKAALSSPDTAREIEMLAGLVD